MLREVIALLRPRAKAIENEVSLEAAVTCSTAAAIQNTFANISLGLREDRLRLVERALAQREREAAVLREPARR